MTQAEIHKLVDELVGSDPENVDRIMAARPLTAPLSVLGWI